jgi:hypothetical protein
MSSRPAPPRPRRPPPSVLGGNGARSSSVPPAQRPTLAGATPRELAAPEPTRTEPMLLEDELAEVDVQWDATTAPRSVPPAPPPRRASVPPSPQRAPSMPPSPRRAPSLPPPIPRRAPSLPPPLPRQSVPPVLQAPPVPLHEKPVAFAAPPQWAPLATMMPPPARVAPQQPWEAEDVARISDVPIPPPPPLGSLAPYASRSVPPAVLPPTQRRPGFDRDMRVASVAMLAAGAVGLLAAVAAVIALRAPAPEPSAILGHTRLDTVAALEAPPVRPVAAAVLAATPAPLVEAPPPDKRDPRPAESVAAPRAAAAPKRPPPPAAATPRRAGRRRAASGTGTLVVRAHGASCQVWIDGAPRGKGKVVRDEKAAGRHVVTMITPSGTRRVQRVDVEAADISVVLCK